MSRRATRVRVTSDMQYADIPYFLTTADVEVLTGQSQATIRRAIREGKIKADLIGGQYRICRDTIFQNTKEALSA
ncbi:MAG: helix-turn-helix domain-containing protein [Eggerthellaceae bacterium]|nr:helix-turn-helix domain-containing protein [Eggerthellaceae bacterium]